MLIAQITDLHAGQRVEVDGRIIDTLDGARRAVAHLNALAPRPQAVVVTGDLVAEERRENYDSVAAVLGGLSMPFYVIPGNHDDRGLMREVFGGLGCLPCEGDFLHYVVELGELRLIALDTHDPGEAGGRLCETRLGWLEQRLGESPERPTLVAMHHPPFATGIPEFDRMGLAEPEAFGEIVARSPQVKAIMCGHVHRDIVVSWRGTLIAVTPSTGYQYGLELNEGPSLVKVAEPPAARLFLWNPKSGLRSHISYIAS